MPCPSQPSENASQSDAATLQRTPLAGLAARRTALSGAGFWIRELGVATQGRRVVEAGGITAGGTAGARSSCTCAAARRNATARTHARGAATARARAGGAASGVAITRAAYRIAPHEHAGRAGADRACAGYTCSANRHSGGPCKTPTAASGLRATRRARCALERGY